MTATAGVSHLAGAGELVAARRFNDAEAEILRVLDAAPADPKALNLLALVRYKLGRLEDARAAYRQVSVVTPQDAGTRRNLGLLALKLGRFDEAVPELEMAVRITPDDTRAWSYLGYAYAKNGDVVAAAAAFRQAGQDDLAVELEQTMTEPRPGTPPGRASYARPVALAPPLPPLPPPSPAPRAAASIAPPSPPALPSAPAAAVVRDAQPIPLLSFVLVRLGQSSASVVAPLGALRLPIKEDVHARADAVLAGSGELRWERGARRAQGRRLAEPLGGEPARAMARGFFCVSGTGELWISGQPGRWMPLHLDDDVLYVREERVLAFEGSLTWEAGAVPNARLRMLQFRGRGVVAVETDGAPFALKVTESRPALLPAARLFGWVGRLVPHGTPLPEASPFQLACEGEGVALLDRTPFSRQEGLR
jgi:tetratricopeptide repeat protein/biogenesis AIM24-like protein